MYHLHTQSRVRHSDVKRTSIRDGSGHRRSLCGSVSVASVVDSRALYEIRDATNKRRSRLLWLPAHSNSLASGPSDMSISRRLSLPAVERTKPLTDISERKRHSSLKSAKGIARQLQQTSQANDILFPGSVRLVSSEASPDIISRRTLDRCPYHHLPNMHLKQNLLPDLVVKVGPFPLYLFPFQVRLQRHPKFVPLLLRISHIHTHWCLIISQTRLTSGLHAISTTN
jgi:hypothetical protein